MDQQEHRVERRLAAIFAADEQDESSGSRAARRQNRAIILLYWPTSGKALRYTKGQKSSPIAD